jgi:hypothetical protein
LKNFSSEKRVSSNDLAANRYLKKIKEKNARIIPKLMN